jgi:hypothetical protein
MAWFTKDEYLKDHDGWVAVITVCEDGEIKGYWCKPIG